MCYKGFWAYRGSNDFVFTITEKEEYVFSHFKEFCENEIKKKEIIVRDLRAGRTDRSPEIACRLDWTKLTCVALMAYTTGARRKSYATSPSGDYPLYHVKFSLEIDYIANGTQVGRLVDNGIYDQQLKDMNQYWASDAEGTLDDLADPGKANKCECIIEGPLYGGGNLEVPKTITSGKNSYIITRGYYKLFQGNS